MSQIAELARSRAKQKASRLVAPNKGSVDASGWQEPGGENGDVQTGPRPISRRQFRSGGKVLGAAAMKHAGRKPRAAGGPISKPARNMAEAAMKMAQKRGVDPQNSQPSQAKAYGQLFAMRGGRPARASGGMTANEFLNRDVKKANESRDGTKHVGGMKHGGSCGCAKCGGGRVGRKAGGAINDGTRPAGDRIARAKGGRAKKGMNVNIIIAPGGGAPKPAMPPPGMAAPPGPIGMHQGAPPPMPPAGAAPPMGPPMMRKSGGRVADGMLAKPGKYPLKDGSGGGKGRLEKARAYG